MKINLIIPSFYPATIYGGPIFSTLHTCKELAKLENININVSTTNTNMHSKLDVETNKDIKFEDVNIWQEDKLVMSKVEFKLATAETCYIIGKTKKGKTITVFPLLSIFYSLKELVF